MVFPLPSPRMEIRSFSVYSTSCQPMQESPVSLRFNLYLVRERDRLLHLVRRFLLRYLHISQTYDLISKEVL